MSGVGRDRARPVVAGKTGRGGAARLLGQPRRPARGGHGALKPALVRENDWTGHQGHPELGSALGR